MVNTIKAISNDNISLLAAGVAFYALLAIFPGLAFLIALYGLWADPAQVQQRLTDLREIIPAEAWNALNTQITALLKQGKANLSIASIISLALALFNARLAAYAMMGALNIVYKKPETRSFLQTNVIAFAFTLAALALLIMNVFAVLAAPQLLNVLGLSRYAHKIINDFEWPLLFIVVVLCLAVTYRFGPDRKSGHWHWVTFGSFVATTVWLIGTLAFSWYVRAFNSYDRLYGSFGAVVILLYWFWVAAFDMQIQTEIEKDHEHPALV
jgi:membrane protein